MRRSRATIAIIDSFEACPWYDDDRDWVIRRHLNSEFIVRMWQHHILDAAMKHAAFLMNSTDGEDDLKIVDGEKQG